MYERDGFARRRDRSRSAAVAQRVFAAALRHELAARCREVSRKERRRRIEPRRCDVDDRLAETLISHQDELAANRGAALAGRDRREHVLVGAKVLADRVDRREVGHRVGVEAGAFDPPPHLGAVDDVDFALVDECAHARTHDVAGATAKSHVGAGGRAKVQDEQALLRELGHVLPLCFEAGRRIPLASRRR